MNPDVQPDKRDEADRPQTDNQAAKLAKRIRAALGPYNDEERPLEELVGVLVNHVHQANQYRQMVVQGGAAAQSALQSGDPQRALDLLVAVTRPQQAAPQKQEERGDG